nr:lysosomal Pro-X carboxypeptidase-like [Ipomoea trifida]
MPLQVPIAAPWMISSAWLTLAPPIGLDLAMHDLVMVGQTLDHFNYAPQSYATFSQKYVVNSQYWGGAQSNFPIFAYLGPEVAIDNDVTFYGESVPFGTQADALKNETLRGYFNSAQALADFAEEIKLEFCVVCEVLAAWFRLKYPHMGALASSAPLLYFDDITPQNGYYDVVTKDFRDVSESCVKTIKESWSRISDYANQPNGLYYLSRKFNLCRNLTSPQELKNYLHKMYADAAQYDYPPNYPVERVCGGIEGAPKALIFLTGYMPVSSPIMGLNLATKFPA